MKSIQMESSQRQTMAHPTPRKYDIVLNESILKQCKSGDKAGFDMLVRRFERQIYHLAYRLSGNREESKDIAAEAFLRLFRSLDSIDSIATMPAWVRRVVVNVHLDRVRSAKRHPAVSLDALIVAKGDSMLWAADTATSEPYPAMERKERRCRLEGAIASLPEHQKAMVKLYHQEERTYDEIAAILRVPVGTVKSRLNRARSELRKLLEPQKQFLQGSF